MIRPRIGIDGDRGLDDPVAILLVLADTLSIGLRFGHP
jgi:hypothetical protein